MEDRDVYTAQNVFWVPAEVRWSKLRMMPHQRSIGKVIDDAVSLTQY